MNTIKAEDFTVYADRDGATFLSCRCAWEQEFGVLTGVGDDLGSLLAAARDHLDADHPTGDDSP